MPSDGHGIDPRLRAWVQLVETYWRRAAIAEHDRVRMRRELEHDLVQSLAGGATVEGLIAIDAAEFAAEVAAADGVPVRRTPAPARSLLGTVLAGAAAGAVLALVTVYPLGYILLDNLPVMTYSQEGWVAIGIHVVAACVCIATALAAVWWQFRHRGEIRRTLALTGCLFTLGGLVSIAPTMSFARSRGYRGDLEVVFAEIAIVVACCSLGVLLARRLIAYGDGSAHSARPSPADPM